MDEVGVPTLSFRRDRLRRVSVCIADGVNSIARQMQQPRGGVRLCDGLPPPSSQHMTVGVPPGQCPRSWKEF
jgi:hypothetical protein